MSKSFEEVFDCFKKSCEENLSEIIGLTQKYVPGRHESVDLLAGMILNTVRVLLIMTLKCIVSIPKMKKIWSFMMILNL